MVDFIDQNYRTIPENGQRAIMGKSSGGFGATRMAMAHPEVFGLVADHCGDKFFELVYRPEFSVFMRYYDRNGWPGIEDLINNPKRLPKPGGYFPVFNTIGMAACYSPNPKAPLGVDLPFNLETGELIPEVWARWEANDPINMVEQSAENLGKLKYYFIDCGRWDEYNLLYGARVLRNRLVELGIQHEYEEFDGGHRDLNYRYDVSLKKFSAHFS
jgi:enterochelin esterase family protein